jgi:hypothetical protein
MQIVRIDNKCIKEVEKTRQCAILKRQTKLETNCPMQIQYTLPSTARGVEPQSQKRLCPCAIVVCLHQ